MVNQNKEREMYEPQAGDRVVISRDHIAMKARVKSVAFGKVTCTTSKDDKGSVHQIGDVVPLYRWAKVQVDCPFHGKEEVEVFHPLVPIGGMEPPSSSSDTPVS
jgi:hypothetical protein